MAKTKTSNRWFISDTHFNHANILIFTDDKGVRIRPDWETKEEMNEALIDNWNAVVKQGDTVYHLGDVSIDKKGVEIMDRLNGRKILIRGNHDIYNTKYYMKHFAEIYGVRVFTPKQIGCKMVMSHIPIHAQSVERWDVNVHGHLHQNLVMKRDTGGQLPELRHIPLDDIPDERYRNVCVEQINFMPIHFDEVIAEVMERKQNDRNG